MKVIVFTMAYNAEATIKRTIESILNQTFSDFEYYILDNASDDETSEIIFNYSKKDARIIPIRVNKNDPPNGGAFFHTIAHATNAKYMVWCDADDAYTSDFLENMVNFAEENQLDIAACGYDKIDGLTGEVIKHRALEENLVLHGRLFTKEFIKYRGFISYLWGKLYSISFLTKRQFTGTVRKERICNDSTWTLGVFQKAKRAGIYGKAMYQYYQYPHSLSHTNIEASLDSYRALWMATKGYLQYYGKISKRNEDFLYAIHLSLVEEAVDNVFAAELNTQKKLKLLKQIFSDPIWVDTLNRKSDPMFHNLANRKEFISDIRKRVLALPEIEKYPIETKRLSLYFNTNPIQNKEEYEKFDELYQEIESKAIKNKLRNLFDDLSEKTDGGDKRPLVLYGAGGNCDFAMYTCIHYGVSVDSICDTKATGTYTYKEKTYEIISPSELTKSYRNSFVMITTWQYEQEIYDFLCDSGFPSTQIYFFRVFPKIVSPALFQEKHLEGYQKAYSLFHDGGSKNRILDRIQLLLEGLPCPADSLYENGYFAFPGVNVSEKEIYIDGGAYTGDTAKEFIDIMGTDNQDYKIYSFEPDPQNYKEAVKNLAQYSNVEVIPYGLASRKSELKFTDARGMSSHLTIHDANSITVQATSLDLFFADKPQDEWPTIIKLDIEGAEKEALLGAENIIKAKKPQLIICAYHKPEDMYELPQTILKLRDDYKLTFWQIGTSFWDMILYAV